ncbi:hypothetical protein [Streptomyces tendae]|uniref:hypothetical protein n=1 Tax=Streptomyces tendae TaxID=1932 RepID=UPI00384B0B25
MSRRIAAAILGADRPGDRLSATAHQRRLPLGRRLLTSVLGVRAHPPVSSPSPRDESIGTAKAPGDSARPRTPSAGRQEYGSRRAGAFPRPLLGEDRQEYERILDAALRSAPRRPGLAAVGQRLNTEQLRTMALNATALITAAAATEYQHYVEVRELSRPVRPVPAPFHGSGSEHPGAVRLPLGAVQQATAGPAAVVAVFAPVLAATVAVFSLLVGFVLKILVPGSGFARTLLTVGWVSGAVAAAAFLVAAVGLLLTALRNGRTPPETRSQDESSREVDQARDAWREALLERGILPFLREALDDRGTATPEHPAPPVTNSPIPSLGHQRPGFTSPDFTSPDFGGPAESGPSTGSEESG